MTKVEIEDTVRTFFNFRECVNIQCGFRGSCANLIKKQQLFQSIVLANRVKFGFERIWFDTDSPSFFNLTNSGFELISWDLSVRKDIIYIDAYKEHSIYLACGNVGIYAGLDYEKGIGFSAGASLISLGYDGKVIDASFEVLTAEVTYMYKDGKLKLGGGAGWFGFSVSIDIFELIKYIQPPCGGLKYGI